MAIEDAAHNPLPSGTQGQMLGYTEPPAPEEVLTLRIYRFLIEQIRVEDAKAEGAFFVKRFLEGPQAIWADTQGRIFSIRDLWDISRIDDAHLQYLKNIVGWTPNLNTITDRLDADKLRKLIATSIPLWKQRGTDDALQNVITLVTGARTRVWDWFTFRWVLDETEMGEEHQGRDPWIIDLPGFPNVDEYRSNLRVVDDGTLDTVLIEELVKLMRAAGERWEISFIDFLDRFLIDGDDTQWFESGMDVPVVEGGLAKLSNSSVGEYSLVSLERASEWTNYVVYVRMRGAATQQQDVFGVLFYWDSNQDYYAAQLDMAMNAVWLIKVTGGVWNIIALQMYQHGVLTSNVFYGIRVQVSDEGATNRIKVYVDSDLIIDATDSDHSSGSIGFFHTADVSDVEVDEVEMFQLPMNTSTIDINS